MRNMRFSTKKRINASLSSAKCSTKRQKMKITGDGNCRNGYHKVKCQVPETEELHRRERGEKINHQSYNRTTLNQH